MDPSVQQDLPQGDLAFLVTSACRLESGQHRVETQLNDFGIALRQLLDTFSRMAQPEPTLNLIIAEDGPTLGQATDASKTQVSQDNSLQAVSTLGGGEELDIVDFEPCANEPRFVPISPRNYGRLCESPEFNRAGLRQDRPQPIVTNQTEDLPIFKNHKAPCKFQRPVSVDIFARSHSLHQAYVHAKGWGRTHHTCTDGQVSETVTASRSRVIQAAAKSMNTGLFDFVFAFAIIANAFVMLLKLEKTGQKIGYDYRLQNAEDERWPNADEIFDVLDWVFCVVFLLEFLIRVGVERRHWFQSLWNYFDLVLITSAWFEKLIQSVQLDMSLFRLVRLLRLARVLRIVRLVRAFRELRVLIRTVVSSVRALFWSVILLGLMLMMAAIFLGQILQDTLEDPATDDHVRSFVWLQFGTAGHTIYTLFVWMLSGSWAITATRLIQEVDGRYSIFVVVYIVIMNFTLIRVVGAVFIKDTWAAAKKDTESVIEEVMQESSKYAAKVEKMFKEFDEDGDGFLTKEQFHRLVGDHRLQAWLAIMEIDSFEIKGIFDLLDNGDGLLSCSELITGAMKCRGDAKEVDLISVIYEVQKLKHIILAMQQSIDACIEDIDEAQNITH